MRLIAFTGYMQSGKTTAAEAIGAERLGFAKSIKDIALCEFGWNGKKDDRGRKLLQDIGKIGRRYNSHIWITAVYNLITNTTSDHPITIDDLRFNNEAEMLKKFDCTIIKIIRDGYGSDGDETEQGVDDKYIDHTIYNNSTIEDLQNKVRKILSI